MRGITRIDGPMIRYRVVPKAYSQERLSYIPCLRSKVMGPPRRAMGIPEPRFGEYILSRGFLDIRNLIKEWILCNLYGI